MNNNAQNQSAKILVFLLTVLISASIAQAGSFLINSHLAIGETYTINGFLQLTHVRNFGGVFGSFQGHSVIFALISSLILIVCTYIFLKGQLIKSYQSIFFGLIVGGGISNVLDRVFLGSVVDFINLQGIPHWHYVFNTADVFIHIGIWPTLLLSFLPNQNTPLPKS